MTGTFGKIPSVESEKGSSGRASGGVGASTLEAHIVGGDPETARKVRRSVETLGAASRDGSLKAHDTTQVGGKESQPLQRWEYVKRKKLTREQKYNKEYYLSHKGDAKFEKRRALNAKKYRAKSSTKKRRNKRLREKWATDAAYRKHISEYQKAWRKRRNLAKKRIAANSKRNARG